VTDSIEIIPPGRWQEALDLLLARLPADVRPHQQHAMLEVLGADRAQQPGFLGNFRGDELTAVGWLQLLPGRVATLWPPGWLAGETAAAARVLTTLLTLAQERRVSLVQSLLLTDEGPEADLLQQAGLAHIADLLYLVSMSGQFPSSPPANELTYVPVAQASDARLAQIVERTYEGTLDCPMLNGSRSTSDVLEGYRAVGTFRPELWLIARDGGQDVGCILLADHAPEKVWEVVYTGVVPQARGRGFGLEMTRHAQWLAAGDAVGRMVLAVDAANAPAIAMYSAAGFVAWDRRSVFVRMLSPA
jgi:ribosomal protein S18 acetylase RimI-like enzyme